MKDDILKGLKEKFDYYDLWDVAQNFYEAYKMDVSAGIMPEVRFEDHKLPADDCFKTLVAARNAMKVKSPTKYTEAFSPIIVKDILQVPYACVIEAALSICKNTGFSENAVYRWYEGEISMFFVKKGTVEELASFITSVFDERICRALFKEAIILGIEESKRRIGAFIANTGCFAYETIYSLYVKRQTGSYLLYPYYTNPIEAIDYLGKFFDKETVSHILTTDTMYLYVYKDSAYHNSPHYGHDREYIENLINAYQQQIKTADKLQELRKNVATENVNSQWEERFIPLHRSVAKMLNEYPYCPKLKRALICTVTAFADSGIKIPDEFMRYNGN